MTTFYKIEQDLLCKFNMSSRWADYNEELDDIYMSKIFPLIMKHFKLFVDNNSEPKENNNIGHKINKSRANLFELLSDD